MTYDSKLKSKETDDLFKAILSLENEEECYRFFEDIFTIKELQAISQRFQVAKLLSEKKTYNEIEEITKASTATISRVNRCLLYGADGYKLVLERIKERNMD
ncbi:MAG: TrpR-like protein YerC/YecD [Clostridiales bacterium]|jgi:TrpR-related protein YerC/YecD|nr:TrpR-like protein YerC/YecD [Clostridiales bacterium]